MEKSKLPENKDQCIDLWIKSMLVGRESDGYPVFQEDFLRQGVKEFPFKASQLFQMLVTNFSHCKYDNLETSYSQKKSQVCSL